MYHIRFKMEGQLKYPVSYIKYRRCGGILIARTKKWCLSKSFVSCNYGKHSAFHLFSIRKTSSLTETPFFLLAISMPPHLLYSIQAGNFLPTIFMYFQFLNSVMPKRGYKTPLTPIFYVLAI